LSRLLPAGRDSDVIRGDLLEEYRRRAAESGAGRANAWYWREALSLIVRSHGYRKMVTFDSLRQDARFAFRSCRRSPAFTVIVVTTLALGIGASTAIFSVVNAILLKPLPFPEPDRLLWINEITPDGRAMSVSWPNYLDWRARAHSFEVLAASRSNPVTWTGASDARRVEGRRVTYNFFDALGVPPALGRPFVEADDRPGAPPVAIVTHDFADRQLGGAASALGQTLTLDGRPFTVVGVLPPHFRYLREYAMFVAMGAYSGDAPLNDRGNHAGYFALGRLKPGVSEDSARRELTDIEASLVRQYPDVLSGVTIGVEPLASRLVSDVRQTLLVLLGAVGALLLIACVNVASLLVARGAARQQELAVRSALGGGRLRLATQLLVESTLLSAIGGALGVGFAYWMLGLLVAFAPGGTPRLDEVSLDARALLFAVAAASACGILFGGFPAAQGSAVDGYQALLRARGSSGSARATALRRTLLAVEVALALILLTGAGLMVRTLIGLTGVDAGLRPEGLLTLQLSAAGDRWTDLRRQAFVDEALRRIAGLPGVTSAAAASSLAIDGSDWNSIFVAEGRPLPAHRDELPSAAYTLVTPGYLATMATPLLRGRTFTAADRTDAPLVVMVNEALARATWPREDPIGKRIKQGWPESPTPWRTVVGVVHDVKFEGVSERTPMQIYLPFAQDVARSFFVLVRTAGDPAAAAPAIESVVHSLDRDLPVFNVRRMTAVMDADIARQRMAELVLGVFAVVALVLAAIGLVAHAVTERTREIGVRMALGANRGNVLRMIVRDGLTMTLAGVIGGLAGAAALAGTLKGLLFGVKPIDPVTLAAVVALLTVTTAVACLVPAWRAVQIPPTTALRAE
jgi:putative ABC transport system permease protein